MTKEVNKIDQIAYRILMEPWITEEATRITQFNKYVFRVAPKASKKQIKKSIEDVYGVTVKAVNTTQVHRKKRIRGATLGWKAGFKKAIVTLKEGDKIELFEGK